ncbi:O-acyltransferase WSD1 [Morus notabilis]|uniref:O-acyltransferase WSD1 n=1 Tax=Morus notabilis TaxID=981085 RepID=W9RY94_9ROSA|nr:O-acyltransferase WSD1 [Morus notabilis]
MESVHLQLPSIVDVLTNSKAAFSDEVEHALQQDNACGRKVPDCRKASDPKAIPTIHVAKSDQRKKKRTMWGAIVGLVATVISGGDGVELWPRKLTTARFCLEDMNIVKRVVANATINDVLFGVISSRLSRYLEHRTPNALQDGFQITGLGMVNLRKQPGLQELSELMKSDSLSRWGNKFGMVLLPVQYHKPGADILQHVKRTKVMLDRKKQSLKAQFSYKIALFAMSFLGSKAAGFLNYRIVCNTSFTISNIVGPQEDIAIGDNPVTYMRALTMHMLSYAGRADMQILVAKDIIPDPEFLAQCFEDALFEMKEEASTIIKAFGPQEDIAIGDNPVTYMRALTMHMLSYAGRADMQILVAKDIIPDPEFLAQCFEDALFEMKEEASTIIKAC